MHGKDDVCDVHNAVRRDLQVGMRLLPELLKSETSVNHCKSGRCDSTMNRPVSVSGYCVIWIPFFSQAIPNVH